jgi:hypothetical protein
MSPAVNDKLVYRYWCPLITHQLPQIKLLKNKDDIMPAALLLMYFSGWFYNIFPVSILS